MGSVLRFLLLALLALAVGSAGVFTLCSGLMVFFAPDYAMPLAAVGALVTWGFLAAFKAVKGRASRSDDQASSRETR